MRRYSAQEKAKWLLQWKASGLTSKAFAADKPFHANSLNYWNKNTRTKQDVRPSFIEVIATPPSIKHRVRFTFPTGVILEMDHLPPVEDLKAIVR